MQILGLCVWYGKNTFYSAPAKLGTLRFFPPWPKYAEIFSERWPKYTHYALGGHRILRNFFPWSSLILPSSFVKSERCILVLKAHNFILLTRCLLETKAVINNLFLSTVIKVPWQLWLMQRNSLKSKSSLSLVITIRLEFLILFSYVFSIDS